MQTIILNCILGALLLPICYVWARGHSPQSHDFESYKAYHGKSYQNPDEEYKAKKSFDKHAAAIREHNQAYAEGRVTYQKELNQFADVDPAVFQQRNGFKAELKDVRDVPVFRASRKRQTVPSTFDWRNKSMVSPVLDQGQCGSCWSFSANGAMESQVLIQGHKLMQFSEQQLVDCDTIDAGCNGGMYENAWSYIQSNKGIQSLSAYPYRSFTYNFGIGGWCSFSRSKVTATVSNFSEVATDYNSIMTALTTVGPLSIAIDASQGLQTYSSGVYQCASNYTLDHAVLLVGYNNSASPPYWIVKNSWSTSFGYEGFFNLAQGSGDCGMSNYPAYPIVSISPTSG